MPKARAAPLRRLLRTLSALYPAIGYCQVGESKRVNPFSPEPDADARARPFSV